MVDVESPVDIPTTEPHEIADKTQIAQGNARESTGEKHPLKYPWTLWYDGQQQNGQRSNNWGENMKEVYTFSTVEDFWRLYNNVALASQLSTGCSFNLFKKGIEPKWEDPKNAKGGKWTVLVNRNKPLDTMWLWMMLACIGEVLEDEGEEQICGCVVNIRKGQDKLSLWTSDENTDAIVLKLGQRLKKALELPDTEKIYYSGHNSARVNKHEI